jgi:putative ABC transport system permease protein
MMRPRWRKVLADLTGNLVRSLLVVVSIAVGLVAVGMIIILYHIIGNDMREGYTAINAANIQVRSGVVENDFIDHLSHLPGVKQAEGMRFIDLRIRTGAMQFKPIKIKTYAKIDASEIDQIRLVEGRWPPGEKEIALEANRLGDTKYRVGDMVEIKLTNSEVRSLRLVAIVNDQTIGSDGGGAGFFLAPIQGYITRDTLAFLGQPDELNSVHLTVDGDGNDLNHIQNVSELVAKEYDRNGIETFGTVLRRSIDHPNAPYIEAMKAVLYLLGFLVVFLSGFLIINTLSALLNHQIEQIGVMKTFGATRFAVIGIYLALVFVYSLLGLALALPVANIVAIAEVQGIAPVLNFLTRGWRLVPQSVVAMAVIALIVPQAAALLPVIRGTSLPIQQALGGAGSSESQSLDRLTLWLSRLRGASRPMAISLRNTFRQRLRLGLTLTTLALGGAIFIGTFNMRASLESYIARLGKYFIVDANITFNEPYRINEVASTLSLLPDVKMVEGWAIGAGQMILPDGQSGETVLIQGPPENSKLVEPMVIRGRWLLPGDRNAVALNELFLERFPDIHVGDRLRLKIMGQEDDWTVVGFYQFAGKNIGLMAFTNYDALAQKTHTYKLSSDFRVVSTRENLSITEQEAFSQRIETYLTENGYKLKEARAGKALRQRTTSGLDALTNFLLFLAMLMAVVGSIGLTGTMSLNVLERTREIGVMRAIGAADGEILKIVITEGMLIGLLSWVMSTIAAWPVSLGLSEAIGSSIFGSPLPYQYVMTGPIIWFGIILIFSIVASILPARSAVRLTIREILAYE